MTDDAASPASPGRDASPDAASPGRVDHEAWSALAVAAALDALDPVDEERFRAHAATCDRCRAEVAETSETMAGLAGLVAEPPPAALRGRILADARATGRPVTRAAHATPLPARSSARGRWVRPSTWQLAAAASVVVLAVVATTVWALVGRGGSAPTVAERCAQVSCPTARLVASGREVADALVVDGVVYVRPTGLAPNDAARDEYVLWRLRPGTPPTAVGGFDVTAQRSGVVEVGRLRVPVGAVSRFAITREPGRAPPAAPTAPIVATGALG